MLFRYIQTIGRKSHSRAELYGRTSSNILDLALTFEDLGVNIPDLEEYVQHFEVNPSKDVPTFPIPGQDNLNHLRPGSKEVLHRPLHVYDYLPPMYPELEEEEEQAASVQDSEELEAGAGSQSTVSTPTSKRREPALTPSQSDDGRPLREISSVIMTTGGFLSPCREGKLPERGSRHVVPDPEDRRPTARRHLESESDSRTGELGVNIKQEPSDIIPSINIKQEVPDEDDMDFEQRITAQEVNPRSKKGSDVKPKYTTSENIERLMDAVVERGMKAYDSQVSRDQSDDELEPPLDMKPPIKKEDKKSRKRPPASAKKPPAESSDLFSAPQHFTAGAAKTPPKQKLSRIPKITEKVTLPSQSSLMSGMSSGLPGMPGNPLIPNFGMNLYGFGQIPASLIPGFNPLAMANAMAMAAASSAANTSRDSSDQSAVTLDDELEEGEISPPDTPTLPARVKTETSDDASTNQEDEQRNEEEIQRREEKEREAQAELNRKKEREKIEREREKQREEERQKLLLLSKERERLRKIDEEKEREKTVESERSKDKEKIRDPEKEKKKSKKDKKDKDRDKSKKDKKKEKKEKKKMKEKERKSDEPQLFAPILKIKPVEAAPSSESPAKAVTPKLVIKNIPKDPPVIKQEAESVPLLGFQPLRTGPARTPKSTPGKIEKKTKRASTESPVPGPSSAKKPRETKIKVKSKEIVDADSGDETPGIITETVGSYLDESGNKVWICPACGKQDDGSPMIGCDKCDDW